MAYLFVHSDSSWDKQKGLISTKRLSERLGTTEEEEGSNTIIFVLYE